MFKKAVLLLSCATSVYSLSAFAESDPSVSDTITITASRIEQPVSSQTNSITVLQESVIEQVSAVHVSELLNRVPGVWVSRGNGQESLIGIRSPVLTGAGSCGAFFIAEHGVPVRSTGFCNVNQLFDLNTEQAQSIEVLRGPGTALHSSDALHGVINVLSEPSSKQRETRIGLEAGPNDYGRIKLTTSNTDGQYGYRVNFNGASDGGYQDDSGFDQQKFNVRLDYDGEIWDSLSLFSATNLNQETAGYVVGTDAYKDKTLRKTNPNPEAYRDSQSLRWQTQFERRTSDSTLIITPYVRHLEMEFLMHFLPGQPTEENGQSSAGFQTSYHFMASDKWALSYGADAEFTDAYLKQNGDAFLTFIPEGQHYDYDVTAWLLAGFFTTDYLWSDKLSLHFGARYETLEYDYENNMISGNTDDSGNPCASSFGCRYTRPEDRSDQFNNLSANAGLVYHINDAINARGKISHGFRAPQATELYRLQSGQVIADLDSEELNSIELGISGNVYSLTYDFAAFYMKKNNVIFQSQARQNLDNGKTRHKGIEYGLLWQINNQWNLGAGGTFARHTYENNVSNPGSSDELETKGNDIVSAPRRMSSVQLGWLPTENTQAELEWVSMGNYYTDLANEHRYDGHDLLHFRLRHQLNPMVDLGFRIHNLTNKYYAERADFSNFVGDRYFIGLPRSAYADIEFTF